MFERFIHKFRLNPTALSKFLECPLAFYYEKVLQIPSARTPSLGFGNAVHTALEYYMNNRALLKQGNFDAVIKYFEKGMENTDPTLQLLNFKIILKKVKTYYLNL